MSKPNIYNKRIDIIDALRGFALLGILLLHAVEHFSFMQEAEKNPELFHTIDSYVNAIVTFIFSGKAFTIFSLMFGFSFYTIIDNNFKKGIDFRTQFAWRLVVLFLFGYIYSAILLGEILTIYALLGIPLIFLFKLNRKILLWLALLCLIQIPTILRFVMSYWGTDFNYDWETVGALFGEAFQIFGEGSFFDVAEFNLWKGHKAIWLWAFYQGRLIQSLGLFILGLYLGKTNFFKTIGSKNKHILKGLVISAILFISLTILKLILPKTGIQEPRLGIAIELIETYLNLALSAILILVFIVIYQKKSGLFSLLIPYGRMSLTNYVLQALVGVPVFYGFGFGLYNYFGATLSLIFGIFFLLIQLYFSKYWLKNYKYGPLEWLWRAITYFNFKLPSRRISTKQ